MLSEILARVRAAASQKAPLSSLCHLPDVMVRTDDYRREVELVVRTDDLIENYPEDARGDSCLLLGYCEEGRPVHVVRSPKEDYLAAITVYLPDPALWSEDLRRDVESGVYSPRHHSVWIATATTCIGRLSPLGSAFNAVSLISNRGSWM